VEIYISSYPQEEEKARFRQRLSKEAIDLALQGRWEEAEAVNRDIIEKCPSDVEAYNPSLSESMATLSSDSQKVSTRKAQARRVALDLFITEVGKVGVVSLHNLAPGVVLAKMGFGDQVHLEIREQHLIVASQSGEYLGQVEPRQGLRLIKLMRGGNRYDVAILNVEKDKVQVIIKEVYQHPNQVGCPSFLVKATEHLRTRIKESLLRREIMTDESEAPPEPEYSEEEEYLGPEEESVPEGFTVIGEDGEREIEV
jgi:hypothetical protein